MRQFQTSVVEFEQEISNDFSTEPFECAWAGEAIFFIHIDEVDDADLDAHVQISPDGVKWLDEGTNLTGLNRQDGFFVRVDHFGGWLRLRFTGKGKISATIRLALKE